MRMRPWFLLVSLMSFSAAQAALEVHGQLVAVREKAEAGTPKPEAGRGGGPKPIEQSRVLEVTVHNQVNKPESSVTVRYWFLGRDAKTSKLTLLDGGESQINLRPNGTEMITSKPVKSTWTPRPVFVQPAAKGGKPAPGAAATAPKDGMGTRISGYAVQVIKDGKVIGSDGMDDAIKTLVGSDGTTPGALFKAEKSDKPAE